MKAFNKIIKTLIFYDLISWFGWGLVMPIIAIFVADNIKGGDVGVAGIAIGIYWILKSLMQIPIGKYLDTNHGERDDFYFLVGGSLLAGLVPFGFIIASLPWHIYALQAIHAIGMAAALPAWCGIFTRHIDKGHEAQAWAWDSSSLGVGMGVAGILGGVLAKVFGFIPLFIGVGVFRLIAALMCFLSKMIFCPKKKLF